jgi:hypothetical protein
MLLELFSKATKFRPWELKCTTNLIFNEICKIGKTVGAFIQYIIVFFFVINFITFFFISNLLEINLTFVDLGFFVFFLISMLLPLYIVLRFKLSKEIFNLSLLIILMLIFILNMSLYFEIKSINQTTIFVSEKFCINKVWSRSDLLYFLHAELNVQNINLGTEFNDLEIVEKCKTPEGIKLFLQHLSEKPKSEVSCYDKTILTVASVICGVVVLTITAFILSRTDLCSDIINLFKGASSEVKVVPLEEATINSNVSSSYKDLISKIIAQSRPHIGIANPILTNVPVGSVFLSPEETANITAEVRRGMGIVWPHHGILRLECHITNRVEDTGLSALDYIRLYLGQPLSVFLPNTTVEAPSENLLQRRAGLVDKLFFFDVGPVQITKIYKYAVYTLNEIGLNKIKFASIMDGFAVAMDKLPVLSNYHGFRDIGIAATEEALTPNDLRESFLQLNYQEIVNARAMIFEPKFQTPSSITYLTHIKLNFELRAYLKFLEEMGITDFFDLRLLRAEIMRSMDIIGHLDKLCVLERFAFYTQND